MRRLKARLSPDGLLSLLAPLLHPWQLVDMPRLHLSSVLVPAAMCQALLKAIFTSSLWRSMPMKALSLYVHLCMHVSDSC